MKKYIPYLIIIILALLYFNKPEIVKTKTVTNTIIKKVIDTVDNTKPTKIEKVFIKIVDTIRTNDTIEKVVYKDRLVNKYTYIDTLKNGVLESVILADKIYKRDVKLTTFDKETTTTTTNYIVKSNLWIGTDLNINKSIQSQSLKLYYQHKDKFILSGGIGYNYAFKSTYYSVGLAIKF
tara:strand:- start:8667 stop:9203 length:537 start_codon:yes stop_codon:yes gene_type:complete